MSKWGFHQHFIDKLFSSKWIALLPYRDDPLPLALKINTVFAFIRITFCFSSPSHQLVNFVWAGLIYPFQVQPFSWWIPPVVTLSTLIKSNLSVSEFRLGWPYRFLISLLVGEFRLCWPYRPPCHWVDVPCWALWPAATGPWRWYQLIADQRACHCN